MGAWSSQGLVPCADVMAMMLMSREKKSKCYIMAKIFVNAMAM
jgi:hypothetical protein